METEFYWIGNGSVWECKLYACVLCLCVCVCFGRWIRKTEILKPSAISEKNKLAIEDRDEWKNRTERANFSGIFFSGISHSLFSMSFSWCNHLPRIFFRYIHKTFIPIKKKYDARMCVTPPIFPPIHIILYINRI